MRHANVLVVGAGPAGLAAATAAATNSRSTIVLDDNAAAGGQIWREAAGNSRTDRSGAKTRALEVFRFSGAELLPGRRVVDAPQPGVLSAVVETANGAVAESFTFDRLILATGARERFLPFPGWTLPGVFGAGGLEALVKGGFNVKGKRVVLAGTGPLLLAVGAHLVRYGAKVVSIAEQAPPGKLMRFAATLGSHPEKLMEGVRYRATLGRVPYRTGCWVVSIELDASGGSRQLSVRLTNGRRIWSEACDIAACAFHLVPNTELAALLGCKMQGEFVDVDAQQLTSVTNVFCAGEPTGIAGVEAALVQGEISGLVAADEAGKASVLFARRNKQMAFARGLDAAFRLRPELRELAAPDTIVCRCEDVGYAQLRERASWRDAKLGTRCGMGPCQGRICGPAVQALFGWHPTSIRPPLFPVPLSALDNEMALSKSGECTPQETL